MIEETQVGEMVADEMAASTEMVKTMEVATPAEKPAKAAPPRRLRLDELKPGAVVPGTVKNITQFGAFVDIGAEQEGLVHISELSENRVRRVEDVVKVGQAVEVTILEVDPNRRRISLSMKARSDVYDAPEPVQDDDREPTLTTMQAAFLKAQQKAQADARAKKAADTDAKARKDQEDILNRTLTQHRDRK